MCDQGFNVYVARPSGILVKFDVPDLSVSASIQRDQERPPAEFLPTYPMPRSFDLTYLRALGGPGYWGRWYR